MNFNNTFSFEKTLTGYLKPRDRQLVSEVLCHLTLGARELLCSYLLDFMEGNGEAPSDVLLGGCYLYLTQKIRPLKTFNNLNPKNK